MERALNDPSFYKALRQMRIFVRTNIVDRMDLPLQGVECDLHITYFCGKRFAFAQLRKTGHPVPTA